jgi:hypothetical protein
LIELTRRDSNITSTEKDLIFYQNYPNPFSSYTYIRFYIPEVFDENTNQKVTFGQVRIKIYNILGQEIGTLLDEVKTAGQYEIKFTPTKFNLSGGVYFLKLEYGKSIKLIKLIFLK